MMAEQGTFNPEVKTENTEHVDEDLESSNFNKKRKRYDYKDVRSCNQCEFTGGYSALWHHKKYHNEGIRYRK